jgi:hypothetical protein
MTGQSNVSKTYSRQDSSGQWVSTTYHDPYLNHARNLSAGYSTKPSPEAMAGLVIGAGWAFDAIASAYKRKRNATQEAWWQSVLSSTVLADPEIAKQVDIGYWLEFITSHKLPIGLFREEETTKLIDRINNEFRSQGFDVETILAGIPHKLESQRKLLEFYARDENVQRKFGWNNNLDFKTFDELVDRILSTGLYDVEVDASDLNIPTSDDVRHLVKKFHCGKCKKSFDKDYVMVVWSPPYESDTLALEVLINHPNRLAVIGDGWICFFREELSCDHAPHPDLADEFYEHGGRVLQSYTVDK